LYGKAISDEDYNTYFKPTVNSKRFSQENWGTLQLLCLSRFLFVFRCRFVGSAIK
jgi:hypothetical protein